MGGLLLSSAVLISLTSCNKTGPAGANGSNGADGVSATEACKACHNPSVVDRVAAEFQMSKHEYGIAAEEEAGSTSCGPCHEQEGFKYVCANNIPSTITWDVGIGKYVNNYATVAGSAYGAIGCYTCHSSLHTTYGYSDMSALTSVAPVAMTMWGGNKIIDLVQSGGKGNLCVKCHQPRPLTVSSNSRLFPYDSCVSQPNLLVYDTNNTALAFLKPGYRTGIHYGAAGAIFSGKGGIEFPGISYASSDHTTAAACQDCHMAPITGKSGGHSFFVKGNFNGCNASCHSDVSSSSTGKWNTPRNNIKGLLATLAGKLTQNGIEIMNINTDSETNLWYGITTSNYDGYLNFYDPINNPTGETENAGQFKNLSTSSSWTAAQIAHNNTLPRLQLSFAQFGAIINFQLCLREYSCGIHNYNYSFALLTNSIAMFP